MQSTAERYQTSEVTAEIFNNTKDLTIILQYKSDPNSAYYEDYLITSPTMQLKEEYLPVNLQPPRK